jgi:cytochrome P450
MSGTTETASPSPSSWQSAPRVPARMPWVGPGLSLLRDPTAFFERSRRELGGTYWLETFGYPLLCTFSPVGVKSLWALPEAQASKGLGDFALLSHKLPTELFAGRRSLPHDLFGRENVEVYLGNLAHAIEREVEALGDGGVFEAFAWMRRLAHRVGLASWGSPRAVDGARLETLVTAFDTLDSSESFVHPHKGFLSWATGKRRERAAIARIESIYAEILGERDRNGGEPEEEGFFARICDAWADETDDVRSQGIARDVMLVHMGSQSNLFAAMAWTLVHLLERPTLLEAVRAGDDALLERCAHESIRLRQRSIVLRRILAPCVLETEEARYALEPGLFLATMMSVTNTRAAAGLDTFDPDHYAGPQLVDRSKLAASELVTTFGHGAHYCPAARFSVASIRLSVRALLDHLELEPQFSAPKPLRRQIGGVARADRPCRVAYRRRV